MQDVLTLTNEKTNETYRFLKPEFEFEIKQEQDGMLSGTADGKSALWDTKTGKAFVGNMRNEKFDLIVVTEEMITKYQHENQEEKDMEHELHELKDEIQRLNKQLNAMAQAGRGVEARLIEVQRLLDEERGVTKWLSSRLKIEVM